MEIEIDSPGKIPEYNYNHWNIDNSKFIYNKFNFQDFFNNFMLKNLPCIIKSVTSDWMCTKTWIQNDDIYYDYIESTYGDIEAPIADCNDIQYNSQNKTSMKVSEYIQYLRSHNYTKLLYLKDWHLRQIRPDDNFYVIPQHFALDWLNEYAVDKKQDDFMFVYIGPQDSWTPLHEDVYCSYSWSVNVIGRKKWILFPPGEENKLKDSLGNLPLMFDSETYKNVRYFEIIQEKGDAIFVPSGWYHQVINEVNTISINHNWINACNIDIVWKALQNALVKVEFQIEDLKDSTEYFSDCQLILKSLFGMNYEEFITFLCYIGKKRLDQLQGNTRIGLGNYYLGDEIIKFDLKNIRQVMESIDVHPVFKKITSSVIDEFKELKKSISNIIS